jgi:hypothetical protein
MAYDQGHRPRHLVEHILRHWLTAHHRSKPHAP